MTREIGRLAVLTMFLGGCDPATGVSADAPGAASKADEIDDGAEGSLQIVVAEAGVFTTDDNRHAKTLRFGFTDEHAPGWVEAGEVEITYDDQGHSEPLVIDVPADREAEFLAFVVGFVDDTIGLERTSSTDQFIPLDNTEGTMIRLPLENRGDFPGSPECFNIDVDNVRYDGVVEKVFFAFTDKTQAEYDTNNDVPWFDVEGNPVAEGSLRPVQRGTPNSNQPTTRMLAEFIRVPAGMNLVFKLAIAKYRGQCEIHDDTSLVERTETKTYFVPVP